MPLCPQERRAGHAGRHGCSSWPCPCPGACASQRPLARGCCCSVSARRERDDSHSALPAMSGFERRLLRVRVRPGLHSAHCVAHPTPAMHVTLAGQGRWPWRRHRRLLVEQCSCAKGRLAAVGGVGGRKGRVIFGATAWLSPPAASHGAVLRLRRHPTRMHWSGSWGRCRGWRLWPLIRHLLPHGLQAQAQPAECLCTRLRGVTPTRRAA